MIPSWVEASYWHSGLVLLNLDFARPVYVQLGTGIQYEETLRGLSRDTISGKHTNALTPIGTPDDLLMFYTTRVVPLLGMVESALGCNARDRLTHWIKYAACTEDKYNPWLLYLETLLTWVNIFRRTGEDRIGFSSDPQIIARELRSAGDLSEPKAVLSAQTRKVITEWDLPFFKEQGLLEIPEGSDFFPFVDQILLIIDMKRFQDFWQWFVSFVSTGDLRAVAEEARRRAAGKDVAFCEPEQLPLPPEPDDT